MTIIIERFFMSHSPDAIVACARGWIGTQFHHQGRLKRTSAHRGGVDCLGLLVGVAHELGLKDAHGHLLEIFDERDYSHQPDSVRLQEKLKQLMTPMPHEQMRAGDVVLMNVGQEPQHLGIITKYNAGGSYVAGLLHAYAQARGVVEHALDEAWRARIVQVYRIVE